jgi:hypothetical protein
LLRLAFGAESQASPSPSTRSGLDLRSRLKQIAQDDNTDGNAVEAELRAGGSTASGAKARHEGFADAALKRRSSTCQVSGVRCQERPRSDRSWWNSDSGQGPVRAGTGFSVLSSQFSEKATRAEHVRRGNGRTGGVEGSLLPAKRGSRWPRSLQNRMEERLMKGGYCRPEIENGSAA